MRLQIEHQTIFSYDEAVREAIGEARLQPRTDAGQQLLSFRLTLDPAAPYDTIADRFGNTVHCYSVLPPHRRLVVTATSLVDTSAGALIAAPELTPLERYSYVAVTPYVPFSEALRDFARSYATGEAEGTALALANAIYTSCTYEPGSTDISTTADVVLAGRRGVCQDFAHLLIALARCLGLPARYVSGYFHDPAQPPDAIVASHAWAEVFLAGRGWLGLDPTHNCITDANYVRVAIGRDYADAAPMRGVYKGGAKEKLAVRVRLRAADEPHQVSMTN